MNREEILEEITKTKEHLTNMEKMLEECKYERWRPVKEEQYFIVDDSGVMDCINIDEVSVSKHYAFYNCFKTKEEAEQEAEKILIRRQLEDIAKRLNKGEKIDWDNYQLKYSIELWNGKELSIDKCTICKIEGAVYCLDKSFKDIAIQEIGEERLIKYLKGE